MYYTGIVLQRRHTMSKLQITTIAAMTVGLLATTAYAETFRDHFMANWDLDGNGAVTLQEVEERRESVFAAFDADDDGFLDASERGTMAEMRDSEHAAMAEDGIERPRGMGHGKGQGRGQGKQRGMGQGKGMGGNFRVNAEAGMHSGHMIDTDGDGKFSNSEFVGMSAQWLARLDANSDGEITQKDF
jgi:hypothetical protein